MKLEKTENPKFTIGKSEKVFVSEKKIKVKTKYNKDII